MVESDTMLIKDEELENIVIEKRAEEKEKKEKNFYKLTINNYINPNINFIKSSPNL